MFDKIAEIVSKNLSIKKEDISLETSFEDMDADSLDIFQVIIELEEEFNIKIDEVDKIKTVGDIINCLKQKGIC
jgi:acyl carrier protein